MLAFCWNKFELNLQVVRAHCQSMLEYCAATLQSCGEKNIQIKCHHHIQYFPRRSSPTPRPSPIIPDHHCEQLYSIVMSSCHNWLNPIRNCSFKLIGPFCPITHHQNPGKGVKEMKAFNRIRRYLSKKNFILQTQKLDRN